MKPIVVSLAHLSKEELEALKQSLIDYHNRPWTERKMIVSK